MNVVFLDIDGVLNNDLTAEHSPAGFIGISDSLIKNLAYLTKASKAVVVLSSTWKDEWSLDPIKITADGEYLQRKLNKEGIRIADKIDDSLTGAFRRGAAIQLYLDEHPNIENYVILDDLEFDFADYEEVQSHFLQTDEKVGLTKEKALEAIAKMQSQY